MVAYREAASPTPPAIPPASARPAIDAEGTQPAHGQRGYLAADDAADTTGEALQRTRAERAERVAPVVDVALRRVLGEVDQRGGADHARDGPGAGRDAVFDRSTSACPIPVRRAVSVRSVSGNTRGYVAVEPSTVADTGTAPLNAYPILVFPTRREASAGSTAVPANSTSSSLAWSPSRPSAPRSRWCRSGATRHRQPGS